MTSSERSPSKAFGFIEQTAAPRILYVRPRHGSADAPEHAGDLQLPIGGQHFFPARRALAGEQDVVKIAKHVRLAALSNRRVIHETSIRWDTMRGLSPEAGALGKLRQSSRMHRYLEQS